MLTEPTFAFTNEMRSYFDNGETISLKFRIKQLKALRQALKQYEKDICEALYKDLRKNEAEAFLSELGLLRTEVNLAIKKLASWMRPQRLQSNLISFPSSSYIYPHPKGVVLIIGAWNYPFLLNLAPLVGAIAGGNCVVLKPSEHAPASAAVIDKIIKTTFPEQYITVVQGEGSIVVPALIEIVKFNHIFYTGSNHVGKLIYQLAAEKLTPVTLELGGKSPVIVEQDANIATAAKRIVFGKFINAGQTCVAPDYLLVHESVQSPLLDALKKSILGFYGNDASQSLDYGRIINKKRFDRLVALLKNSGGEIVIGGNYDPDDLYISPTVIKSLSLSASIMQEEIFGPLLPVFTYSSRTEAFELVEQHSTPLAFYLFTSDKDIEDDWLNRIAFGSGCINNTIQHLGNPHFPFGGIGQSGIGMYRGVHSFNTFTHARSIMKTPNWFDPAIKYPPYKDKLKWLKKIL